MKKYLAILIAVLAIMPAITVKAQDYSQMNLHFVYIDHETSTPVNQLCKRIRTLRDDAIEVEDALIVYLSDGRQSLFSFTNLKDRNNENRDTNEAFVNIIAALQDANSHDIIAREDRKNILNLFDEYNFIDEQGHLLFNSVTMDFYVGPDYWNLGNHEKVIAHLFVDFDASSFDKTKLAINIFKPKGVELKYPKGMPFGDNNIEGINQKLSIFEY
jgi:hypothetical protein